MVGSDPKNGHGRGVVSTANYVAREYGIRSAMPISHAWQASQKAKKEGKPEVVFMPTDFAAYQKSSEQIYAIIKEHAAVVEAASIDEFYFDLSGAGTYKKAEAICKRIKKEINKKEKITCSVGIGPNKLIAKIAADIKKPDGLFIVRQQDVEAFLEEMPIRKIPGIGPKSAELLYKQEIFLIKDLKKLTQSRLQSLLGKWGLQVYDRARGVDGSPVTEDREAKSIGEQNTFDEDTLDAVFLGGELETYCNRVFKQFAESEFSGFKTMSLTVRFSDFQTQSSAKSVKPMLTKQDIKKFRLEALKLLLPFLDRRKNPKLKRIRLIGIQIKNLVK